MGLKADVDFARYLSMGAIGTATVATDLRALYGHQPIELERQSMANKRWGVKIKRERIPDLLCVLCGLRVEAKAKSKLEVKLSDSATVGREWHAGGLRDTDLVAFVRVLVSESEPVTGAPAYFTAAGLKEAAEYARKGTRKAASQGSELDISWRMWVPQTDGIFVGVRDGELVYLLPDGKERTYWQSRDWPAINIYSDVGAVFVAGGTIVAGVVPSAGDLTCPHGGWDIANDLDSTNETDLYAAIKAVGVLGESEFTDNLVDIAKDDGRDWRIRLEASASLARLDPDTWTGSIASIAADPGQDLKAQLEAVFILSEIAAPNAHEALSEVAEAAHDRHEEVRSAAIWGLGTGALPDAEAVLPYIADPVDMVAMHAAAAIGGLTDSMAKGLVAGLGGNDRTAAVSAAILAKHGRIKELLTVAGSNSGGRLWALRALGDVSPAKVLKASGGEIDAVVRNALDPIWIQHKDWLRSGNIGGPLDVLSAERVRFDPLNPHV